MHELRHLGYKRLQATDPVEDNLRSEWYAAKDRWETAGAPVDGPFRRAFMQRDKALSDYLWKRASDDVMKDRAKHPKAKRNLPVPPRDPESDHPSRAIP